MPRRFTVLLAGETRGRLFRRARQVGMPECSLAQRYIEESLRHDRHPLIQFLDGPSGRRASMIGSGLDVWEVIDIVRGHEGSAQGAAAYLETPVQLAEAAIAYYVEHPEEIEVQIELNEAGYRRGLDARSSF